MQRARRTSITAGMQQVMQAAAARVFGCLGFEWTKGQRRRGLWGGKIREMRLWFFDEWGLQRLKASLNQTNKPRLCES